MISLRILFFNTFPSSSSLFSLKDSVSRETQNNCEVSALGCAMLRCTYILFYTAFNTDVYSVYILTLQTSGVEINIMSGI